MFVKNEPGEAGSVEEGLEEKNGEQELFNLQRKTKRAAEGRERIRCLKKSENFMLWYNSQDLLKNGAHILF